MQARDIAGSRKRRIRQEEDWRMRIKPLAVVGYRDQDGRLQDGQAMKPDAESILQGDAPQKLKLQI